MPLLTWLFMISLLPIFSCAQPIQEDRPAAAYTANLQLMQFLVEGNNRFAFECYKSLRRRKGNICFSSYSLSRGLAMAAIGTSGRTANEIQKALSFALSLIPLYGPLDEALLKGDPYTKGASKLYLANALWVDANVELLASFKKAFQRDFLSSVRPLDFSKEPFFSAQAINQWILEQTDSKIKQFIKPQDLPAKTQMVLTTAMAMKGQWVTQFSPRDTKRRPFRLDSQRVVTTEMMQTTLRALLWKGDKWDMVVLPYVPGNQKTKLAMLFLIPKTLEDMEEMENSLTRDQWKSWLAQLKLQGMILSLPRFKVEDRFELNKELLNLGLFSLFAEGADFSRMTDTKEIGLNAAIHKTLLKIDEKGTDAGVAGIDFQSHALEEDETPYLLTADHPFVFMVMDLDTQCIFWLGRLTQP